MGQRGTEEPGRRGRGKMRHLLRKYLGTKYLRGHSFCGQSISVEGKRRRRLNRRQEVWELSAAEVFWDRFQVGGCWLSSYCQSAINEAFFPISDLYKFMQKSRPRKGTFGRRNVRCSKLSALPHSLPTFLPEGIPTRFRSGTMCSNIVGSPFLVLFK